LVSSQLSRFHLQLPDLDNNNKIKIPWGVQRELMQGDEPTKGVSQYLMQQSHIDPLKNRLLSYLYTENREGAILESACRFIDKKAWSYTRPIQVKLEMARDIPRLADLKTKRERVSAEIEENARRAETVDQDFVEMSKGGTVDGRDYPGYEALLKDRLTEAAIQQAILNPAREWLFNDVNFRAAKKARFAPFTAEVDRLTDAFLQSVCEDLNTELDTVEAAVLEKMGKLCEEVDVVLREPLEAPRSRMGQLRARILASSVGYLFMGGILGTAVGAASAVGGVFGQVPDVDLAVQVGIAAGAGIGGFLGLLTRAFTSKKVRRNKLITTVNQRVKQLLLGTKKGEQTAQKESSVREQLLAALDKRRTQFSDFVRGAFETALEDLRNQAAEMDAEAEELTRRQQEVISRLEPKIETLSELGRKAAAVAEVNAPHEGGVTR
jgi:hypothetical protein